MLQCPAAYSNTKKKKAALFSEQLLPLQQNKEE
jgi:hypothetical protein